MRFINNCQFSKLKQMAQLNRFSSIPRRKFIFNATKIAAGSLLLPPLSSLAHTRTWTVGEIMDLFISKVPGAPFPSTVDTLKSGSRDSVVKGIITTMFATIPVIRETIRAGANFIIAHEPTFYNHLDNTDWLKNNQVYQYKAQLLKDNGISVWRNHDYIHSHRPDGVYQGVLEQLGWAPFTNESTPRNVNLPSPTSLANIIKTLKQKLDISNVRFIGDTHQQCSKILLLPGAAGGERQIRAIAESKPDVVLVGELQEWETAEFVRDARAAGQNLSLVVMGHTDSEDGGSIYMRKWLKEHVPDVQVTHIHSGNPFSFA